MTIVDYSLESDVALASNDTGARGGEGSWDRTDWQRMWLRTQSFDWKTLALVPGDDQTSTFDVANLIAKLARDHGESIHVADMRALRLKHVDAFLEGTLWETNHGTRIIFATRSTSANLATVRIARAADFAILCVSVGSTSLDGIRSTIELIGRKHFLGSLLVRGSAVASSLRPSLPPWTSTPKSQP